MLSHARLQTIIWTSDTAKARPFYEDVLGLKFIGESTGALVFDVGGSDLRVSPVPSAEPSKHTVVGFAVENADAVMDALIAKAVSAERFEGFRHAPNGVWEAPDGTRVGWFRDPDGNLLSVVQYRPR